MPTDKKQSLKGKNSTAPGRGLKPTAAAYSKKAALLEEAITQMNAGKYGRSSSALKDLLAMDPHNMEARRLFATLHLRLGSLIPARQAFDSLIDEAFARQDYWLAESLLREYLAAGPRCVPYLEKLGSIHQDKGDVIEAVEQYGKAIDILVEDPDPDKPNHASQLYDKIKILAPGSHVANRVAGYFDAQTGALIAHTAADVAAHSALPDEASAASIDSEPMVEIAPWAKIEESLPIEEAVAPLQDSEQDSEVSPDASGFVQHLDEVAEVAEAVDDALSVSDSAMDGSGSMCEEPETTSIALDDAAAFSPQQVEVQDDSTQDIQQEGVDQVVSPPLLSEELCETSTDVPDQAVTESPEEDAFLSTPEQASPGLSSEVAKEGVLSQDYAFKTVWNRNSESAPTTNTPSPTMETLQSGTMPVTEPDTTDAPSAGAPMPWDQVQESTITISQEHTEESVADSPIESPTPSVSSAETMARSYQKPAAEEDRPPSVIQPADDMPETADLSIGQSSPGQPTLETDAASDGLAPILSHAEPSIDEQETQGQPFTFASAGEQPMPVEETPSTLAGNSTDLSSTISEAAVPSHEDISFALKEGAAEPAHESYVDESESVSVPEQASPVNAGDRSRWMADPVSDQIDRHSTVQDRTQQEEWSKPAFIEAKAPHPEPAPKSEEEWSKPGESIRFVEDPPAPSALETTQKWLLWGESRASEPESPVASAVDVLFESSSDRATDTKPRERTTRSRPRPKGPGVVSRIGASLSGFIGSCFSTTRAIVMSLIALAVLLGALAALGVSVVGVTWMMMEESPSPAYQSFTAGPQRTMLDPNKNGYALLLRFDVPAGQDPVQAGSEHNSDAVDADKILACLGGAGDGAQAVSANASEKVLRGWFRGSDPVGQFTANQSVISRWASQGEGMLGRYRRWQRLPFEDWGYGQAVAPPCVAINFAHHLYVAEGFAQQTEIGIDRLKADMEAWRVVLAQAKTLPVKVLAIQAVRDDAAVASGLLARPDFDGKYVDRVSHMLRPLSQAELSIRWPMQSELVRAAKTFDAQLKAEKREGQPLHAAVASALPLPEQRRLNSYAAYYEVANQAAEAGQHGALPKLGGFIKSPAATVADYFTNPIENVIGVDPLPSWDSYNGLAVDADAHLRLASLQAWIRRGWHDSEILSRLAKAGQAFYDPYTGLPMLVNQKKRVLYSVGRDGKDQDGDPEYDVVVAIPGNQVFNSPRSSSDPSLSY